MGVLERMIHSIWSRVAADDQDLVDIINAYRHTQGLESVVVEVPELPFPRIPYDDAIEIVKQGGGDIEWGDDIESHHCDLIASKYPGFHFIPRWPMSMKPFYIHHKEGELGSTGSQLSRGFDLNYGRDEMTSGGQREHRVEVLEQNLRDMDLDPDDFSFYTDGFRYGAPPHAGWGLGVARLLMVLTGAGNVREVVLFPRDRSRVTPDQRACISRTDNSTISRVLRCVASKSTVGGAQPSSSACFHLFAQRHHLSPGFRRGNRISGLGVVKSFPCACTERQECLVDHYAYCVGSSVS